LTYLSTVDGQERFVTYGEWSALVQTSFEKCYYVPLGEVKCCGDPIFLKRSSRAPDPADDTKYAINPAIVSRRGIYKDVYGSGFGREWSDYQFRPNFSIAMTVAPEMFDNQHALNALKLADQVLRGPLGMKTLDPTDQQYRPIYDNANDSYDPAIAKGLNYHNVCFLMLACLHDVEVLSQGPEWGWPLGYFLRAYLHFATFLEAEDEVSHIPAGYSRLIGFTGHKGCSIPSPSNFASSPSSYPERSLGWYPRTDE
jgi:glycogen debranching enzyme